MRLLITGANGFVGLALCRALMANGMSVVGMVRSENSAAQLPHGVQPVVAESLDEIGPAIGALDCVVHLAARVHQMHDAAKNPLAEFRSVNTRLTAHLARWAAGHGVRRFVFLSSIKVNGEGQRPGEVPHVYTENDDAAPQDPYGISKWEGELELARIASETGLETVILRPTLIYGPQVKANFRQLLRLASSGLPLPFGGLKNVRSLTYLGNLVDAIRVSIVHPKAGAETFLVSDGDDLSTADLIRELRRALGSPSLLIPMSSPWLERLGHLAGKTTAMQRLLGTLQVDSQKIRDTLNWHPPFTARAGLRCTADWYQEHFRTLRSSARAV